jgi:hypothetical protein
MKGKTASVYRDRLKAVLTPDERRLLSRLNTPNKIQDYLDTLPINFELHGETYMSPRRVIALQTAHCFEGALLAAAAIAYHGGRPLLLDIQTSDGEDHVIALYKRGRYWGAISKTNHSTLRYRDPLYASVRELALSYAHEYIDDAGVKTMRAYSAPYDLSRLAPERWVTQGDELFFLVDSLDRSKHFDVVPNNNRTVLRRASMLERHILTLSEWNTRGTKTSL